MKLSKILETLDMDFIQLDKIQEDIEIFSITAIKENQIYEKGIIYIGCLSEVPAQCVPDTTFFCSGINVNNILETGLRNVLIAEENVQNIFNHLYPLFQKYMELSSSIVRLVTEHSIGMGLNHLLSVAYDVTGLAVHLMDNNFRLIAYNKGMFNVHPDYDIAIKTGKIPQERVELISDSALQGALHTYDNLYFMWGERDRRNYLTALIYVNGVDVAWFAVLLDAREPFKHYDFIRFLYQLCTMELQREVYSNWNENIMQKIFFKELIEHSVTNEYIERTLKKLQWVSSGTNQLLIITEQSGQIGKDTLRTINKPLWQCFSYMHYSDYNNRLIVILDQPERITPQIWKKFRNFLVQFHLVCGVSEIYHGLVHTPLAYEHALKSLEYLIRGTLTGNICDYSECMYYILHDELEKSCRPSQFYHPGVFKIFTQDQEKGTDKLKTLETYLDYIGFPDLAASRLNIHRNTLFYRIKRIQTTYNLNLDNGKERLHIMLTIKFLRTPHA